MNARRIMAGLAVTTLVLGTATLTFARGYQGRMAGAYAGNYGACYYNAGYQDLTPEKRAAVDKLIQDHVAEVTPLREQLQAKHLELNALSANPNAKPDQISRLSGEVAELSSRLNDTAVSFREKMAAETGFEAMPYGGYGRGGAGCVYGCAYDGYGRGYDGYGRGGMAGRGMNGRGMNGGYYHMGWNR